MARKNLVSQPPLTTPMTDNEGALTKAWSIWFRDVYFRTSYKGGNAIDQNKAEVDQELIGINSTIDQIVVAVNVNIVNIATNVTNIQVNTDAVAQNIANILTNKTSIEDHEVLTEAHGSNGEVVGKLDLAEEALVGLVKQMGLIADAVASVVSVTSADIAAAPGAYDQTYTDTVKDLANETKADLNTLVTDVNNAITKINDILAETITSGQMNNV